MLTGKSYAGAVGSPEKTGELETPCNCDLRQLERSVLQEDCLGMGHSGGAGGAISEEVITSTAGRNVEPLGTMSEIGEVCLLQTTKIPAGYKKTVRVNVRGAVDNALLLFTLTLDQGPLQMADGAIECGDGRCATVIVENHRQEKLTLKQGMALGTAAAAEVVTHASTGAEKDG